MCNNSAFPNTVPPSGSVMSATTGQPYFPGSFTPAQTFPMSPAQTFPMSPAQTFPMSPTQTFPMSPAQTFPQSDMQTFPQAGTQAFPSTLPSATGIVNPPTVGMVPPQSAPVLPETLAEPIYTPGFLRTQIGRLMRVEFLIGNSTTDRVGVLTAVGSNFIILDSLERQSRILCDLYSIKFVTIIDSAMERALVAAI